MQIKSLLFATFCLLTIAACKHDHDDDTTAPVLTLAEPAENDSISGEVHIEGEVTDESLHEMSIKITKDSDGSEVFSAAPEVHDLTAYHFHEHWEQTVSVETAVTLTIVVEDHNANKTTKTVKFTVKP